MKMDKKKRIFLGNVVLNVGTFLFLAWITGGLD
jgi:hypothetical protein